MLPPKTRPDAAAAAGSRDDPVPKSRPGSDPVREQALKKMGWFWGSYRKLLDLLMVDLGPGPRCIKMSWFINLQKGGTLVFVLGLMNYYGNYSTTAYTYAALHGSYGLVWLLKELVCPDPGWQVRVRVGSAIGAWLTVLGPYWIAPYLLITSGHEASEGTLCAATIAYALGVVLMVGSDAQKYFVLKERKGLITDGFFARVRNPNYLGEMMLYGSFAAVAGHWQPCAVLAWVWLGIFTPNILMKEARMSRHGKIWDSYTKRAGMLFPKF
jgi:protein-S-isoprenylcysteine O-methyltransferase Ste14